MEGNVRLITKQTRNHQLRAVAYSVDGAIFDNDAFVTNHQTFQRSDDATKV